MFSPNNNGMEEDVFANISYSKNIECILPTCELMIDFRINGMRAPKPCLVYAEKMDFKGLIQLRITEKCDQRRMYITTVDSASFHEIKQDQGLNVTFVGFIENLVRILQDCQLGKLEMCLLQIQNVVAGDSNNVHYQLQFVEMRSFKNLVHLSLPCRLASLSVVLFYMNSILDAMQRKCTLYEQTATETKHEIQRYQVRIEQLENEQIKLRENLAENTNSLNKRHADELNQLQENLRIANDQRLTDNERNRKTITALQLQLDKLGVEQAKLHAEKIHEHKRNGILNEELAASKSSIANLKEQIDKLHSDISSLRNAERKNEMHLSDTRKHSSELQEKLKKFDKVKDDIVAELEAEKKISQTKRQALQMATEEISKANEIILKQTQELIKLKKTIGWRTEVALQQEKAINEKEKLLQLRNDELSQMQITVASLRKEIPQQLASMREFANSLEQKYKDQINTLREKLKFGTANKENHTTNFHTTNSSANSSRRK